MICRVGEVTIYGDGWARRCSLLVLPYGEKRDDWLEMIQYSIVLSPCTMDWLMVILTIVLFYIDRQRFVCLFI